MLIYLGYMVTVIHDFPEEEGIVWFVEVPGVGDEFALPSDGKRVRILHVNHMDMSMDVMLV